MTSAVIHHTSPRMSANKLLSWRRRTREERALGKRSIAPDRAQDDACRVMSNLLTRAAAGDRSAFKDLYDLAAPQLFGIAMALLKRRDSAEDLVQDAFLAIWQRAAQFSPDRGTAMAWMVTIVRHRAIDRLRMDKRRPQETTIDVAAPAEAFATTTPREAAGRDVSQALAALPDTHRRAIMLAFVEGLTHEELAARLNAPLGTVKSWVRRGLQAMKETLAT